MLIDRKNNRFLTTLPSILPTFQTGVGNMDKFGRNF